MVPKQLVSKRLVGLKKKKKKTLVAFLWASTKALDLSFTALIAYSILFGIFFQDSRVIGKLLWQNNKLLLNLTGGEQVPVKTKRKLLCLQSN